MPVSKKTNVSEVIQIPELKRATLKLRIIGDTPLFQNRMAEKVKQTLLVGGKRKTKVEKLEIKHTPLQEYQSSMEVMDKGHPTACGIRVTAIKAAMCTAAIETAGLTKAATQRLLFMPGDLAPLYGTPQLRMDVVRSADMNKTPDVRTRAFFPQWGAEVKIQYIIPQLTARSVATLACNAGILIGVGDFRQEKGKGAFGSFRVILEGEQDDEWDDLVANHARDAQLEAINQPEYADRDTEDLMKFFDEEVQRRAA